MTDHLQVPAKPIANAAEALWGPLWQSEMARAMPMNLRTVQRIAAAARDDQRYTMREADVAKLLGLLERKHRSTERAYEDLKLMHDTLPRVPLGTNHS